MSIHNFSVDEFENVSKDILLHNKFISVRNSNKIDKDTSFRDIHDITSLDIAEFVIELEEKYNELTDELTKVKTSNDNMSSTIEDYKEQIKNLQTANSSLNTAIKQKSAEYNNYIKELETTINSQSQQIEAFTNNMKQTKIDKQIEKASKLHAGVAKSNKINKDVNKLQLQVLL